MTTTKRKIFKFFVSFKSRTFEVCKNAQNAKLARCEKRVKFRKTAQYAIISESAKCTGFWIKSAKQFRYHFIVPSFKLQIFWHVVRPQFFLSIFRPLRWAKHLRDSSQFWIFVNFFKYFVNGVTKIHNGLMKKLS